MENTRKACQDGAQILIFDLCFPLHILGVENRHMYLCLYSKDIHYHIIEQCLEKYW